MNANRKLWNEQHQALHAALSNSENHRQAIDLFLNVHAMIHSATMAQSGLWSFEDEVWQDMTDEAIRRIPQGCEHSVAWIMWHLARIEDVTMNLLVAGTPQLALKDGWLDRMKVGVVHAGNAMDVESVAGFSAVVDVDVLRAYRQAVGRRTREIAQSLTPDELKQKVDPYRLQRVTDERAVTEAAREIVEYWGKRSITGLLMMPATRHNFLHLNEALRVKLQLRREKLA